MKGIWKAVRFPILCFLMTITLALMGMVMDHLFKVLWPALLLWTLATVPVAIALYRTRGLNRLIYGLFEMLVALGVLYVWMLTVIKSPGAPLSLELIAPRILAIFVVIYFMVRALDNIGEGLKRGSRLYALWQKFFPKSA